MKKIIQTILFLTLSAAVNATGFTAEAEGSPIIAAKMEEKAPAKEEPKTSETQIKSSAPVQVEKGADSKGQPAQAEVKKPSGTEAQALASEKSDFEAEKKKVIEKIKERNEVIRKAEPKAGSYIQKIEALSPDGDEYLIKYLPRVKNGIEPYPAAHDLSKLGVQAIDLVKEVSLDATPVELEAYKAILKGIKQATAKDGSLTEDQLLLKADLALILAYKGSKDFYKEAYKDYQEFMKSFPGSENLLPVIYNLAYIYLRAGDFINAVELSHKEEGRWQGDKVWSQRFHSLIMESYYSRKRFIKAEDYLWNLANRIEKDDLNQQLALRYADALFWQEKYLALVEWHKNETVNKFYDDSKPWVQVSGLYLAESLFQVGQYEEAAKRFKKFKEVYKGKYQPAVLDFRVLQCDMMLSGEYKNFIPQFYNYSLKEMPSEVRNAARIQWARLVAKEVADGEAILSEAHAIVTALLTQIEDLHLIKESVYVKALLSYRLGEYRRALDNIAKIYPRRYINELEGPFLKSVGDFSVYLLEKVAPEMWEERQTIDFLVLTDRFTFAVQGAYNKSTLLFWVGRAYVENGMTGSAIHIFEKLLKEMDAPHRVRTTLELAKAYGLVGDTEAMGRALSLIKTPPDPADEKELYYLTKATYQMATKNYAACAEDMDQLLIRGVHGDVMFKYALEGAVCARKAKEYDRAQKMISLLDIRPEDLKGDKIPDSLKEWYLKGLFERINLFAETGKHPEAIEIFDKLKGDDAKHEFPLETVFLVIDSMRKTHDPDRALEVWKDYASQSKNLPKGFGDQFTRLLELLASTELVPVAGEEAQAP